MAEYFHLIDGVGRISTVIPWPWVISHHPIFHKILSLKNILHNMIGLWLKLRWHYPLIFFLIISGLRSMISVFGEIISPFKTSRVSGKIFPTRTEECNAKHIKRIISAKSQLSQSVRQSVKYILLAGQALVFQLFSELCYFAIAASHSILEF